MHPVRLYDPRVARWFPGFVNFFRKLAGVAFPDGVRVLRAGGRENVGEVVGVLGLREEEGVEEDFLEVS